jgi:hypothetical protein
LLISGLLVSFFSCQRAGDLTRFGEHRNAILPDFPCNLQANFLLIIGAWPGGYF